MGIIISIILKTLWAQIAGLAVKAGPDRVMQVIRKTCISWLYGAMVIGMMSLSPVAISGPPSPHFYTANFDDLVENVTMILTDTNMGTAVVIDNDTMVTARHVVDGSDEIKAVDTMYTRFDLDKPVPVRNLDAVEISFESDEVFDTLPLACSVKLAQPVIMLGHSIFQGYDNPQVYGWIARTFIVSKIFEDGTIILDGTSGPGNSGGPVFTLDGELLGIVIAGIEQEPPGHGEVTLIITVEQLGYCNDS